MKRWMRKIVPLRARRTVVVLVVLLVFVLLIGTIIVRHSKIGDSASQLPSHIVSRINTFTPYYYHTAIPGDFALQEKSVHYDNGVLVFQLRNSARNQTITVTEQLTPPTLSDTTYPDAAKVPGVDGTAIIKYDGTRVLGGLFTTRRDGKQTFIILNSTDSIPQTQIEDMLRGLRPI